MNNGLVRIKNQPGSCESHILWSLWDKCNYRCSYCTPWNYAGNLSNWLTLDKAIEVVDSIHEHYIEKLGKKFVQISFTGGEPTLFRRFKELCQFIHEKNIFLGITTNGSRDWNYWSEISSLFQTISISYHPQFSNDDALLNLLIQMEKSPQTCLPAVRLMMHSNLELWSKCVEFSKKLKEHLTNWAIEFTRIQNDFGEGMTPVHYTEDQLAFLVSSQFEEKIAERGLIPRNQIVIDQMAYYENGSEFRLRTNDLLNRDEIYFKGWSCDAGLESLFIGPSGGVYRAGCKVDGEIGSFGEAQKFELPSQGVICPFKKCSCTSDISISKVELRL